MAKSRMRNLFFKLIILSLLTSAHILQISGIESSSKGQFVTLVKYSRSLLVKLIMICLFDCHDLIGHNSNVRLNYVNYLSVVNHYEPNFQQLFEEKNTNYE